MIDFMKVFEDVIAVEGGYVNDPTDRGGETYMGVARKHNPDWRGWEIVDFYKEKSGFPLNLGASMALYKLVADVYREKYWDKLMGDQIPDEDIAIELFDTGINMGISRVVTFLQKSLNILNRNHKLYPDLASDGCMGMKTINAIKAYIKNDEVSLLLKLMNVFQGMHYITLMQNHPEQEKYARGWFSRVTILKEGE